MSVYYRDAIVFPYVQPDRVQPTLIRAQAVNRSPLAPVMEVADRNAYAWQHTLSYENLGEDDARALHSFLARCRGQLSIVMLPDFRQFKVEGSWGGYEEMLASHYDNGGMLDVGNWSADNGAIDVVQEPHAIGLINQVGNVTSSTVVTYTQGITVPANEDLSVRVAVRTLFGGSSPASGQLTLRWGSLAGSLDLSSTNITTPGYYTFALHTDTATTIYPSFRHVVEDTVRGEGFIVDRLDLFRGARVNSWTNRTFIWADNAPTNGHIENGSRVEVAGTLCTLATGGYVNNQDRVPLQLEPGVINSSWTATDSWQLCPILPHGGFRLQEPSGYAFETGPNPYDDFSLTFIGDALDGA